MKLIINCSPVNGTKLSLFKTGEQEPTISYIINSVEKLQETLPFIIHSYDIEGVEVFGPVTYSRGLIEDILPPTTYEKLPVTYHKQKRKKEKN